MMAKPQLQLMKYNPIKCDMTETETKENPASFEEAFTRLEVILEKMNTGNLPLDEALSLYEEADGLVARCSKQLQAAEKKIQILMKNRQNDLLFDENGDPQMQNFDVE